MRALILTLAGLAALAQQPTLSVVPNPVVQCDQPGIGRAAIRWTAPGASSTQIRVGAPDGPAMNGPSGPMGEENTDAWVRDGMQFFLTDAQARVLAQTTARVVCGVPSTLLPLTIGNQWVYEYSDRRITSAYRTWTITRAEQSGGHTWFVMEIDGVDSAAYRADDSGRIYIRTSSGERLLLDPADPFARGTAISTKAGTFASPLTFETREPLLITRSTYAPGIGLITRRSDVLAGSSGGFNDSLELIHARLGERTVISSPQSSVTLSVESTLIRIRPGQVANCAVPCYFAACALVPGADPPNTFKPCMRTRIALDNSPADGLELELVRDTGEIVYRHSTPATANLFHQLPLYSQPNRPFPSGRYLLRARTESFTASAFITIEE